MEKHVEPNRPSFSGKVEAEKVTEKLPEKATEPKATEMKVAKPKVKKTPRLERGSETRLMNLAAGDLFEISDALYRFESIEGNGILVISETPIPGGFRTGRELMMGNHTICMPVKVV